MAKQKTSLTFYGGVNEIGGNKVLLEDKKVRILLDFGLTFSGTEEYFAGWLRPRTVSGTRDYFEFKLLPRIKGIYAKEHLMFTDLPYTEPKINALFLSHAHIDHMGHILFIDEKIPVHCGFGTKILLKSMEETGSLDFGEHSYKTFRTGRRIEIDHIVVEPIHVDHSIPASYGFIVHASEGAIIYTGDLRAHGPRKEMTEEFVEKARESEPTAMICEGTRMVEVERRSNYTESEVEKLSNRIVSATDKIVFVAHYGRDMDRFRTFYNVAKKNERKFVISPKTAHLLSKLKEDKRLNLPDPMKDRNILVYYKRKKTGSFQSRDYHIWERAFLDKMVNHEFVHKKQSEIIMDLDFYQFAELVDIKSDANSHFIHSMSEPYSDEDIEDRVMHNWLKHFKINFHQLHASGHMNKSQLTDLIDTIRARRIFPVHTENQKLFRRISRDAHLVKYGKRYII